MRRALAALAIVLACVLPAAAVASWWAYAQATDTARFMETARPLATDDVVRREVVDELVAVASTRLDQLAVPLPGGKAAVRERIRSTAEALVRTAAFRRTWLAILRTAHARLAARLTGDVTAPLTLDLAPVADVLRARVRSAGLAPVADAIVDPAPVVLLDRGEVRRAHRAVDRIRIVRGIAIPGAILALLGVLLSAGSLARGLVRAGLCAGVSVLLLVGTGALARGAISSSGRAGGLRLAVYDVLTRPL
ncbi:MAG: hypothetical protein JWR63_1755, partial [Conexibacter sp.]|nr:hypothetical protein [Conexibacter sp.]